LLVLLPREAFQVIEDGADGTLDRSFNLGRQPVAGSELAALDAVNDHSVGEIAERARELDRLAYAEGMGR
jgi:hypothetical protein